MIPATDPSTQLHSIDEYRKGLQAEHRLRGYRSACGFRTITWSLLCPRCGQRDLVETVVSGRGSVAAFSVQTVPSEEFVQEAPYAYVLVELEDGGRVSGWMPSVRRPSELAIGDRVHWVPSDKSGAVFEKDAAPSPAGTGV